jgi:hypothetical protein
VDSPDKVVLVKPVDMRILSAGMLFVLIIASGMWTTRLGRPLNTAVFTVHKLIALACLVLMIIIVRSLSGGAALNALSIALISFTFLSFLIMFATGAVLSFEKPAPAAVLLIHRIVPALSLISSAAAVLVLRGRV